MGFSMKPIVAVPVSQNAQSEGVYFPALDGLRGTAALVVALGHAGWRYPGEWLMPDNYLMVDLFFVLSGFVIASHYSDRIGNWAQARTFMRRRFFRLYPLHLFYLLVFAGVELVKFAAQRLYALTPNTPLFSTNNGGSFLAHLFFLNGWGFTDPRSFDGPSWSTSIEFYVCAMFAVLAIFAGRRLKWVTAAGVAAAYVWFLFTLGVHQGFTAWVGWFRGPVGFSLGLLTFEVFRVLEGHAVTRRGLMFAEIFAIALFLLFYFKPYMGLRGRYDCIAPFASMLMVLTVALRSKNHVHEFLAGRMMVGLGTLSYSIYLGHTLIGWFIAQLLRVALHVKEIPDPDKYHPLLVPSNALAIAATISYVLLFLLLSRLTFRYIEAPARAYARRGK